MSEDRPMERKRARRTLGARSFEVEIPRARPRGEQVRRRSTRHNPGGARG